MEQCSENQLSLVTFQDWFLNGKSQLLLADTLSEINTEPLILLCQELELSKLFLPQKMEEKNKFTRFMISQEEDAPWECITQMNQLLISLTHASSMHLIELIHYICQQRTLFWKSMMEDSKTSSKLSMKKTIKNYMRIRKSGMNTDSLMIWLLTWLNLREDLSGHAKTMMVMSNLIV